MLVCYLDDSGTDKNSPLITVGGYVAREEAWAEFETAVEPWFTEYKVPVLHAKELKGTVGAFKDWTVLKKQAFVSRVCMARNPNAMMGMVASMLKADYAEYRKRYPTASSPYTIAFNIIIDWLLRDIIVGKPTNEEGVAFVLECGNKNNAEAEITFHEIRQKFGLEDTLKSICFVPKDNCRAIQLADLLAYYGRRNHVVMWKRRLEGKASYPVDMMMRIIIEGLPHRDYVATESHARDDPRPPWEPPPWLPPA